MMTTLFLLLIALLIKVVLPLESSWDWVGGSASKHLQNAHYKSKQETVTRAFGTDRWKHEHINTHSPDYANWSNERRLQVPQNEFQFDSPEEEDMIEQPFSKSGPGVPPLNDGVKQNSNKHTLMDLKEMPSRNHEMEDLPNLDSYHNSLLGHQSPLSKTHPHYNTFDYQESNPSFPGYAPFNTNNPSFGYNNLNNISPRGSKIAELLKSKEHCQLRSNYKCQDGMVPGDHFAVKHPALKYAQPFLKKKATCNMWSANSALLSDKKANNNVGHVLHPRATRLLASGYKQQVDLKKNLLRVLSQNPSYLSLPKYHFLRKLIESDVPNISCDELQTFLLKKLASNNMGIENKPPSKMQIETPSPIERELMSKTPPKLMNSTLDFAKILKKVNANISESKIPKAFIWQLCQLSDVDKSQPLLNKITNNAMKDPSKSLSSEMSMGKDESKIIRTSLSHDLKNSNFLTQAEGVQGPPAQVSQGHNSRPLGRPSISKSDKTHKVISGLTGLENSIDQSSFQKIPLASNQVNNILDGFQGDLQANWSRGNEIINEIMLLNMAPRQNNGTKSGSKLSEVSQESLLDLPYESISGKFGNVGTKESPVERLFREMKNSNVQSTRNDKTGQQNTLEPPTNYLMASPHGATLFPDNLSLLATSCLQQGCWAPCESASTVKLGMSFVLMPNSLEINVNPGMPKKVSQDDPPIENGLSDDSAPDGPVVVLSSTEECRTKSFLDDSDNLTVCNRATRTPENTCTTKRKPKIIVNIFPPPNDEGGFEHSLSDSKIMKSIVLQNPSDHATRKTSSPVINYNELASPRGLPVACDQESSEKEAAAVLSRFIKTIQGKGPEIMSNNSSTISIHSKIENV